MKVFETEVFTMRVEEDGLIHFLVKKDAILDVSDLWESRRMSLEYLPNTKYQIMMEAEDLFTVTKEAREVGASPEYAADLDAVALVTTSFPLKLLGNLYIRINKPIVPTKLFYDQQSAINWLKIQKG